MTTDPPDSRLDRRTLRERAVDALRSDLVTGRRSPGSRLIETELAESLGVSRGTVREAIRQLQEEGLVTTNARGTVSVRALSATEISEIYAVRAALEGLAVSLVSAAADRDEKLETLRRKLDVLADVGGQPFHERIEADLDFHRTLCELSGNETLLTMWLRLSGLLRNVQVLLGERIVTPLAAARDHEFILDAITGSGGDALTLLHEGMAKSARQLSQALETSS
jgi:DNA-binding GntR family transcriptional regulator